MYERLTKPDMILYDEENSKVGSPWGGLASPWQFIGVGRWISMHFVGICFARYVTGKDKLSDVLFNCIEIPDILQNLSLNGKNADRLCYSANMGVVSNIDVINIVLNAHLGHCATGIEMAMVREGATRLTTRAVDIEGRAYTEHGKKVFHFDEEGEHYFTNVPDESMFWRLAKFKIFHGFSYGNSFGPEVFARYMNCIKFHIRGLHIRSESAFLAALMEIVPCYLPLIYSGLRTVKNDEDSFVVTDEVMTAIISPRKFEILGDTRKLPKAQQFGWHFLKEAVAYYHHHAGYMSTKEGFQKYPELVNNEYVATKIRDYIMGPNFSLDRKDNSASAGTGIVEHLGENRDISKLTERRKINGFGTAVPPPETNSSISTVGRTAPTFSLEGRTYRFQYKDGILGLEATIDDDESKFSKKGLKFSKKNRIKEKMGLAEVDRVIESSGDCECLSDIVEHYIHSSDDVAGRLWLLAVLKIGATVLEGSSCVFDAVSGFNIGGKLPQLDVKSTVRCDVLEAVDVFVSNDKNDERVFLDYSWRPDKMLGIWGTGGMKCASAVKVERSKLRRARIVLDYDVRCNSYIASRS